MEELVRWIYENTGQEAGTVSARRFAAGGLTIVRVRLERGSYWADIDHGRPGGRSVVSWSGSGWVPQSDHIEFVRLMMAVGAVAEHLDRVLSPSAKKAVRFSADCG